MLDFLTTDNQIHITGLSFLLLLVPHNLDYVTHFIVFNMPARNKIIFKKHNQYGGLIPEKKIEKTLADE